MMLHSNPNAKVRSNLEKNHYQAPFEIESQEQKEPATPPEQRSPQKSEPGVPGSGEADSRKKSCSEFGDNPAKSASLPLIETPDKGHMSMRKPNFAEMSIDLSENLRTSTVEEPPDATEECCTVEESVTVTTLSVAEMHEDETIAQKEDRLEREEQAAMQRQRKK